MSLLWTLSINGLRCLLLISGANNDEKPRSAFPIRPNVRLRLFEQQRDEKSLLTCVLSEDWSDSTLSAWRNIVSLASQDALSDDSDQTAPMRRRRCAGANAQAPMRRRQCAGADAQAPMRRRQVKIQISLRECAGWSESSLGLHVQRYVFWRSCSFISNSHSYH